MTSGELLVVSTMFRSRLADPPVFRIVLRDLKRYDTYETREFNLPLGSTFPIGRASKNVAKRDLMPAPHNAYIDSPVISRNHAVLSANSNSGKPEVYITDNGSMHGTILNGQTLEAGASTKLSYGDVIQLGTDVNRNEGASPRKPKHSHVPHYSNEADSSRLEFFVARSYEFESQLSRPFSLGFTVPDPESEEEALERRGSQTDPLVIDDSDAASEQSEEDKQAEVTMMMEEVLHQNEPVKASGLTQEEYPESALRTTIVNEDYEEEDAGDAQPFSPHRDDSVFPGTPEQEPDEEEEDAMADFDSEAGSVGSSEAESEPEVDSELDIDSEPEVQDSDDEEMEADFTNTFKPSSHEVKSSTTAPGPFMDQSTVQPRDIFSFEDIPAPLPRLGIFGQHTDNSMSTPNVFADASRMSMLVNQPNDSAPPLPPRPSASRPPWSAGYTMYDNQSWLSDAVQQPNYMGTNYGDRPSLFSPAPPPPAKESVEARVPADALFGNYPSQMFQADRLQTPPMMPASDVETATPQPGRRTKVSIEEIVEEQPPTPESVHNMKRKADVLEEPVVEEVVVPADAVFNAEQVTANEVVAVPANDAAAAAVQTATIIAQRPKKTPRSVLSRVLDKAAYPLLGATGAVVSFALLSTLPDTFFV
jgi:pSer/pThr/pTyr-binding forkhead associated (FHA) protein